MDAEKPTSRGSIVSARYYTYAKSTGEILGIHDVPCWTLRSAVYPTREVRIHALNSDCMVGYFWFGSVAPLPVPEVIEFERPDTLNCSPNTYCDGTFRIVVDLRGAGWYQNDETMFWVESASGQLRGQEGRATVSVQGTTVEFTFSRLFYWGEGSRILMRYHPWGDHNSDDVTSVYLPFDAPSAELTLIAEPSQIDSAGELVTFTPSAAGAISVHVLDWTWLADDTAAIASTQPCTMGLDPCTTRVYESGRMRVTARVDGHLRTADAHVESTELCPINDPWLTDSSVVEAFRVGWEASYPDAPPHEMRERFGWIVQNIDSTYRVDWHLEYESDVCKVYQNITGALAPVDVIGLVHTHPGVGHAIGPLDCPNLEPPLTRLVDAISGSSRHDRTVRREVQDSLQASRGPDWHLPGYILEPGGLVRFDSSAPLGVMYSHCDAWKED